MRVALAGSALLHLVGASIVGPEALSGARANHPQRPGTIAVRIELPSLPERPEPAAREPRPPAGGARVEKAYGARVATAAPAVATETIALPMADPTVYTARELDSLPVPVLPLDISRLPLAPTATTIRLELLIDEHGTVNDVAMTGGAQERELRASIAATAFVPARKDGRAVRSRIVLSVEPGPERR